MIIFHDCVNKLLKGVYIQFLFEYPQIWIVWIRSSDVVLCGGSTFIYGCESKYKAPIHTLNPQADPYPRSIPKRRWSRPFHTSGSPRADPYLNFDATPYRSDCIWTLSCGCSFESDTLADEIWGKEGSATFRFSEHIHLDGKMKIICSSKCFQSVNLISSRISFWSSMDLREHGDWWHSNFGPDISGQCQGYPIVKYVMWVPGIIQINM